MDRRVWISGLFLSLCGWACQADAQEVIWRPVTRPADPLPQVHFQALPAAGAFIGRPMPMKAVQPQAGVSTGVIAASYHVIASPRPVARTLPDGLDALDIAAPADLTPAPMPPQFVTAPAPPHFAAFAADHGASPADFTAEPIALEPIIAEPKPGPAPAEAAPALVSPPPETAAVTVVKSFDPIQTVESWQPHFYFRGEYLRWSVKKDTVPPLVTTSANPQDFGILGAQTTQVLFGGDGLDGGARSGARFTTGLWLDDCESKGIEISGFFLGRKTETFTATSAQFPVLSRPFFDVAPSTNAQNVESVAFEKFATGAVAVRNTSDLWGMEANARCCLCCGQHCPDDCNGWGWHYRVDGLAGLRYLNLSEDLSITENVVNHPMGGFQPPFVANIVFDDFATHNQFYGAQVGLDGTVDLGRWSLEATGKLAVGDTHQEVVINGGQTFTNRNGTTGSSQGGLLALSSNIGTHTKNAFSVVPEVDLTVSYHVSDHVRLFAGYDFLYWSSVVRPGQQIDTVVNDTLIPNFNVPPVPVTGPIRPEVLFQRTDFWAQGLNLGLEFRF